MPFTEIARNYKKNTVGLINVNVTKENTIIKIKAINSNLKFDFWTFGIVTLFGIIIPQIVISIHPVFINYKFLKYVFAVYSILSFIGSMFLMMIYIYRMYTKIKK